MKNINKIQLCRSAIPSLGRGGNMSDYSLKRFIKKTLRLDPVLQKYRLMSELPPYLHQVVIGLLLSDGSIERPSLTGGARLSVILGINTLPYLTHLFKLFEPFTDSGIKHLEVKDKKTGKSYTTVRFKTTMLPLFIYYHKLFYVFDASTQDRKKNIKIVPDNIESLMTPVVLANLIMGDGNLKKGDNIIRIYTNSFTKSDVEKLASAITNKLGIISKAVHDRNDQYMLTISKAQLEKVIELVSPHMHPSLRCKLGLSSCDRRTRSHEYHR
jgi:hypothetical protein